MNGCAALVDTAKPSTAEITEMAGVIIPSPMSIAAPITTTTTSHRIFAAPKSLGGAASARSARIPPSPSLSTRINIVTYLMHTTTISAQQRSDTIPKMFSWVGSTLAVVKQVFSV